LSILEQKVETLVINKLSKEQYLKEIAKGTIDETAFYLTPKEEVVTVITETSTDEEVPSAAAVYKYTKNNLKELVLGTQKVEQINGSVTIPIATTELSGIVKSSENTNSVSVQGDGTMEVNKININKIVQDSGDTLILKSGDSFI
jgi:hypothetical protein